eukprot:CAMPEP_0198290518 /NCGR_PEP_ID=MMETSP1449-20131203/8352_1 /TAXON_ID=420275 /ORGANISM="Attheya septentrionalis, Strain CCMP2084" /LENGTH=445 /DNA_ID=CAMNT_0043989027 /DNA_START=310 /DNA_END=1647 /DNA_ORIENTATION=-
MMGSRLRVLRLLHSGRDRVAIRNSSCTNYFRSFSSKDPRNVDGGSSSARRLEARTLSKGNNVPPSPPTPVPDSIGGDTTNVTSGVSGAKLHPPMAYFPWRHSPEPLARLISQNPEYMEEGGLIGPKIPALPWYVRGILHGGAASHLGIPVHNILLFRGWEDELAGLFAYSFCQGVTGLLSNTYRIPYNSLVSSPSDDKPSDDKTGIDEDTKDQDDKGQYAVDFDRTISPIHDTDSGDPDTASPMDDSTKEKKEGDGDDDDDYPDTEYMLESKMRNLYMGAYKHGKSTMQVQLRIQPVGAKLTSLFLVPLLTRDGVEQTPALRHSYRNMGEHLEKKAIELERDLSFGEGFKEINQHAIKLRQKRQKSNGSVESTVVAQVSIQCLERFSVTDKSTGKVLQGDGKENQVQHLVRFEMVVSAYPDGTIDNGNWQITDWDDLLDGNVFFF